jgi:uncharacterized protein YuzB (UPF0349 family)
MIKTLVEFCISNLANGSQRAREVLEKDPNLDIIEYGCLSQCGQCRNGLFALVDGVVVSAETAEELVEKVNKHIDESFVC